jgi:hypothetical protein
MVNNARQDQISPASPGRPCVPPFRPGGLLTLPVSQTSGELSLLNERRFAPPFRHPAMGSSRTTLVGQASTSRRAKTPWDEPADDNTENKSCIHSLKRM